MQTTYTSVLARRIWIDSQYATLPYEAGWATEAVLFLQVEGTHPELEMSAEVSPDGINWIRRGSSVALRPSDSIAELPLTVFGNWLRLVVDGASTASPARVLIHVNLKG